MNNKIIGFKNLDDEAAFEEVAKIEIEKSSFNKNKKKYKIYMSAFLLFSTISITQIINEIISKNYYFDIPGLMLGLSVSGIIGSIIKYKENTLLALKSEEKIQEILSYMKNTNELKLK